MADVQIVSEPAVAAPNDYQISQSQELLLVSCYAHYDGSASGDYIPTLEIISDSGHVAASIPMDTQVTGGLSRECTWGPFLRSSGSSTPTVVTSIPWAFMNATGIALDDYGGALDPIGLTPGSFRTSDSTIFTAGEIALKYGIAMHETGTYLMFGSVSASLSSAPAAYSFLNMANDVSGFLDVIRSGSFPWVQPAASVWKASPFDISTVSVSAAPLIALLDAGQDSGGTISINAAMFIVKLTDYYY